MSTLVALRVPADLLEKLDALVAKTGSNRTSVLLGLLRGYEDGEATEEEEPAGAEPGPKRSILHLPESLGGPVAVVGEGRKARVEPITGTRRTVLQGRQVGMSIAGARSAVLAQTGRTCSRKPNPHYRCSTTCPNPPDPMWIVCGGCGERNKVLVTSPSYVMPCGGCGVLLQAGRPEQTTE